MGKDLRYAIRVLLKKPGFALIAILTVATGIAANATIFSLVYGVLLKPLPVPHPDRLLYLWTSYPASNNEPDIFSPANYLDVAARTQTLAAVAGYDRFSFTLTGQGDPETVSGMRATASMADVLAIDPQKGRWFTRAEDEDGHTVVLVSDSFWRNRLAADPHVLGRSLILNGKPYTIIGVLPPRIAFPSALTQFYVPISFTPAMKAGRGSVFMSAVARLKPGVARETAEAELRTIAASLSHEHPDANVGINMGAVPLQESRVGNIRQMVLVLWAAVGFLLAIACANVANLLLAHGAAREKEFAVRRALGAGNARLIRQMLTESMLLSLSGGALGTVLSAWGLPWVLQRLPDRFGVFGELGMNLTVLWYTAGISVAAGILFGLAPALRFGRQDLAPAIRDGSQGAGRSAANRRLGRLLVAGEIAVTIVLLVGAGLALRTLQRLSDVDPGFRTERLIAWQMFLPPGRYPDAAAHRNFYRQLLEQAESVPGVESAALAMPLPFGPVTLVTDTSFTVAGRPTPAADQRPQANITRVSAGYFETMGIPLKQGRTFTAHDGAGGAPVVIVSETLARRHFEGTDPLLHELQLGKKRFRVIGVVGDVKHHDLRAAIRPEFYLPVDQTSSSSIALVTRTAGDPRAALSSLKQRVWKLDGSIPGDLAAPVDSVLFASLAPARLTATLLGVFAAIALFLGLAGVYGVLSYAVSQRTREIGIRLALGAPQSRMLGMVLREALVLAASGCVVGLAGALALTRYLSSLLYGISALDPATYVAVAILVPAAALLAAYHPARRATRVDPAVSLRAE